MFKCYQPPHWLGSRNDGRRPGPAAAPALDYLLRMTRPATLVLVLVGLAPGMETAAAARSDWSDADQSRLRLLLGPGEGSRLAGGIEIVLEPGWYTYWRNPGDAGVAPVFDFSGSVNVADVEVLYPVPERQVDGASTSLIYRDEVVFPINVEPIDADEPVTLQLTASFGVCSEICIPTRTSSAVTLPPAAPLDPLSAAVLQRFRPRVPMPAEPGRFDIEEVTLEGDALIIDVRMPESSYFDLFAEPPAGWYIGQPELLSRSQDVTRYRLPLDGRPRGAEASGQRFRFVAVAGGKAIEEAVEIP